MAKVRVFTPPSVNTTAIPPEGGIPDTIDINDSKNIKSGKYQKDHIINLVKAAKATGVDPNQLLALAWQESNFGGSAQELKEQKEREAKFKPAESGRTGRSRSKLNIGQAYDLANPKELADLSAKTGIEGDYLAPALILRDKLKYAQQLGFKDEASQLQAYNGYGKILPQKDLHGNVIPTKMYGQVIPDSGLDMRHTPLYGKRLLELKADIQKNKDIQNIINTK